jgi:hypothetical protein
VGYRWLAIVGRYRDLEHAKLVLRHGSGITVPVVEVTDEEGAQGTGGPFAVHNVAIVLDVEAVLLKSLRSQLAVALAAPTETLARVNCSMPPSVSWMVFIHCWAFA